MKKYMYFAFVLTFFAVFTAVPSFSLAQDTDGDGTLDSSESIQVACALSRQPATTTLAEDLGNYALVLPESFDQSGLYSLGGSSGGLPRGGFFQENPPPSFLSMDLFS